MIAAEDDDGSHGLCMCVPSMELCAVRRGKLRPREANEMPQATVSEWPWRAPEPHPALKGLSPPGVEL